MPSNALSQKSFGTKTPAVCHPPPWPPTVPIPPLNTARFFCFASFYFAMPSETVQFAASCILRPIPPSLNFRGTSSTDPTIPRIRVNLWPYPTYPRYGLHVEYFWDYPYPVDYQWQPEQFSATRPYVGEPLRFDDLAPDLRMSAVIRETPP